MTDPNYTAMAVCADRSGSMDSIKQEAQDALNAFIAQQRNEPGRCTVRISEFDDHYTVVHGSLDIRDVPAYELVPRGSTALRDAIARTIVLFGAELAAMPEDERPSKVLVIVQTDGQENASTEWTLADLNALIRKQQETYSWDFVFLGANQDAIATGTSMGFAAKSSMTYAANASGVAGAAGAASGLSNYASTYRTTGQAAFSEEDRQAATQ